MRLTRFCWFHWATTTLTTVLEHPASPRYAGGVLAEALSRVAVAALRNMATLGGAVVSAHPWANIPTLLIALGAEARWQGEKENRAPVEELYWQPFRGIFRKTLPLYNKARHLRFHGKAVYTNLPVAGAYRGYGATQGYFAVEVAMDMLAEKLGMDPLELRRRNHIRAGETSPIFEKIGEGREGKAQIVRSCALAECLRIGAERIGWQEKRKQRRREGPWAYGVGMSCAMQGSGITGIDMAAATLIMQDEGTFRLLVGATDIWTGSDTILAQITAEVLGVPVDKIIVYSSDTDFTPFDTGAYASSTTYVSGNAALKAAQEVRRQILEVAAQALGEPLEDLVLAEGKVHSAGKRSLTLQEIGRRAIYVADQQQIAATASFTCPEFPPPFAAFFAEVAVDTETGVVRVERFVVAADCGVAIHPKLAEGQLEGAVVQGVGHALHEEMLFSHGGRCVNPNFFDYKVPSALDVPEIEMILVPSHEPSGPFGGKSIGEVGINGPLLTISNAIYHAVGVRLMRAPFTPQRVLQALERMPGKEVMSASKFEVEEDDDR